jgi:hypothetical protein
VQVAQRFIAGKESGNQQIVEGVVSVGEGVEGSVRRIETAYDIRGVPVNGASR